MSNVFLDQTETAAQRVMQAMTDLPLPNKRARIGQSALERVSARWSNRLLVPAGALFCLLAVLAGVHHISPLPQLVRVGAIGIGISVQVLGIASALLWITADLSGSIALYRRFGSICLDDFAHDLVSAGRIAAFPLEARELAAFWVEQKIKRMERHQLRFIGGSDKLALSAVLLAGWTAWKEVGPVLSTWNPSPQLFVAALIVGLTVGGLAAARKMDRLRYQLDVLQLAKNLRATTKTASPATSALGDAASTPAASARAPSGHSRDDSGNGRVTTPIEAAGSMRQPHE